jgi:hypothetical protein
VGFGKSSPFVITAAACLGAMVAASSARADDDEAPPAPPAAVAPVSFDLALHWNRGGDTPLGYYGLALGVSPIDRLSAEIGVGLYRLKSSLNWAVRSRYALFRYGRWALDVGGVFSRGDHEWTDSPDGRSGTFKTWRGAYRVDAQAGVDLELWSKLHFELYGGLGWMLSNGTTGTICPGTPDQAPSCNSPPDPSTGRLVPYLGTALRYTLGRRPERPDVWRGWYGWQISAFDAAAALLLITSQGTTEAPAAANETAAFLLFSLAPPLVHIEHRRPVAAAVSGVARLAALLVWLSVWSSAATAERAASSWPLVLVVGVPVLDAALLAHEESDRPPDAKLPSFF